MSTSTSFGLSSSASVIRRPPRYRTMISARLRTPVGARFEHALISALTSASVSGSAGYFWFIGGSLTWLSAHS